MNILTASRTRLKFTIMSDVRLSESHRVCIAELCAEEKLRQGQVPLGHEPFSTKSHSCHSNLMKCGLCLRDELNKT